MDDEVCIINNRQLRYILAGVLSNSIHWNTIDYIREVDDNKMNLLKK